MRIRIRILLLINVMRICDHWLTTLQAPFQPPHLHFERPRPPRLIFSLKSSFIADPDPVFHSYADPVPASKNNAHLDPQPCFKSQPPLCTSHLFLFSFRYVFWGSKNTIYLSLGLHKVFPSYRRSLQPSKEKIQQGIS
jgi:hypothetical protein